MALCESLNQLEDQQIEALPADVIIRIENAFDSAAATFEDAGYAALAGNVQAIKAHVIGTDISAFPSAPDTSNDGGDPAP